MCAPALQSTPNGPAPCGSYRRQGRQPPPPGDGCRPNRGPRDWGEMSRAPRRRDCNASASATGDQFAPHRPLSGPTRATGSSACRSSSRDRRSHPKQHELTRCLRLKSPCLINCFRSACLAAHSLAASIGSVCSDNDEPHVSHPRRSCRASQSPAPAQHRPSDLLANVSVSPGRSASAA